VRGTISDSHHLAMHQRSIGCHNGGGPQPSYRDADAYLLLAHALLASADILLQTDGPKLTQNTLCRLFVNRIYCGRSAFGQERTTSTMQTLQIC
jgi:hypothetical protein